MFDSQPHRQVHRGQRALFGPSPSERERQAEIVGFGPLEPVRRRPRELLVMARPPKRIVDMAPLEIDALAGAIVEGMAAERDRA